MKNFAFFLIGLLLVSCHSSKTAMPPPVTLEQSENVRYERIVETYTDTVQVYIQVPQQSFEVVTLDSISHLETDYAESDAWINPDGTLGHNIKSKSPDKPVDVPVTKTDTTENEVREIIKEVPVPDPYPVEKELTWWQKFKIDSFMYLVLMIVVFTGYFLRKPLTRLIGKVKL